MMEKLSEVSGSGPVKVDGQVVGHCAYELKVYRDTNGRVIGQGRAMGDPSILAKMHLGQRVELARDDAKTFPVVTGDWQPGERVIPVEAGPDVIH